MFLALFSKLYFFASTKKKLEPEKVSRKKYEEPALAEECSSDKKLKS